MTFSIAIFSKTIFHKNPEILTTYDDFLKYTPTSDEIFSIIEGGELSYHQARFIKASLSNIVEK